MAPSQVLEIELALANGTLVTLSFDTNPHLFAAARVLTKLHAPTTHVAS